MSWIIPLLLAAILGIGIYNYLSGKKLIRDLIHYYHLKKWSIFVLDEKWQNDTENRSDIIISFTTIPERIEEIDLTLKSLLWQDRTPASINLYLPYKSFRNGLEYVIPERFTRLKSLNIIRVEEDFGPASKFIHALRSLPEDQKILVVDDDNIYPQSYVSQFEQASDKNPESIVCASGWRVPDDLIDKPTTFWSNITKTPPTPVPGTRVSKNYQTDIIQGYSGYVLKPSFFDMEELTNYEGVPKQVRFVDDVWVSAHAKVEKIIFPMKRFCYSPFFKGDFYKSSSLAKINNHGKEDHYDRNNSVALRYFESKWKQQG